MSDTGGVGGNPRSTTREMNRIHAPFPDTNRILLRSNSLLSNRTPLHRISQLPSRSQSERFLASKLRARVQIDLVQSSRSPIHQPLCEYPLSVRIYPQLPTDLLLHAVEIAIIVALRALATNLPTQACGRKAPASPPRVSSIAIVSIHLNGRCIRTRGATMHPLSSLFLKQGCGVTQ